MFSKITFPRYLFGVNLDQKVTRINVLMHMKINVKYVYQNYLSFNSANSTVLQAKMHFYHDRWVWK